MSRSRFIDGGAWQSGAELALSLEESHHLIHVMRLPAGAPIEVVDGAGRRAEAIVVSTSGGVARVRIGAIEQGPPASRVEIAFGIPKPAALEFILRRATEVGVAAFRPLVTRHSLRLAEWNERRWGKIVLEVCKQCQELWFPRLLPPQPLSAWLADRNAARALVLFDETDRAAHAAISAQAAGWDLAVGPEGGWSPEELAQLRSSGALSYGLGRNRLRAEMAAVAGAVLIKREIGEI
jgi:16S rRNA (uracil1498-N3)-methyltransferase